MTVQQAFELALQHHQAGRLVEAEGLYRQILAVQPNHAGAVQFLGVVAHQVGRYEMSVDLLRQAITLNPSDSAAHSNLGETYRVMGSLDEAIAEYRLAIELKPDYPMAFNNLGNALMEKGRLDEAAVALRQAIELQPDLAEAHYNLGNLFMKREDLNEAIAAFRQAIEFQPEYTMAYYNLGGALRGQGQLSAAVAAYSRAIELQPNFVEGHNNLGTTLMEQGRLDEAIAEFRQAVELKPGLPRIHNNIGMALVEQGRIDEAIEEYRLALELEPNDPVACSNSGGAVRDRGKREADVAAFPRTLEPNSECAWVQSNLIYALQIGPDLNRGAIADEYARWNRSFSDPVRKFDLPHTNEPDLRRRLRIGYVSPDFCAHPVSFFMAPLLEAHDHGQFEIYCYANVAKADELTQRLQKSVKVWRDVRALPDVQFAEIVRNDGIDVLVDLAMHTAGNRLPVFARQPAPVQVSWLAYPGSSGLERIGYRLSDAHIEPLGQEDAGYGERVIRLPDCWCCYAPVLEFPSVGPLPAAATGTVTFASLNQFGKTNEALLRCWSRLLTAVPESRFIMICPEGKARERTRKLFEAHGVAEGRLELVGFKPWSDYARLFGRIDVALDSFPCNGMTTTCHSLWMGLPVVTQAGTHAISRAGFSILQTLGLPELAARSDEEYVEIAAELARDIPRLGELRGSLRSRMAASPLMDAARFARNIEAAYRAMWREWCTEKAS